MTPKEKTSPLTNVSPSYPESSVQDGHRWLEAKRKDDNVDRGLWRIQNQLYNLTEFASKHPGGSDWIKMSKGHDITELFLSHHIHNSENMQSLLRKYHVGETTLPRNSKFQFDEDGFYMTLRRRVAAQLPDIMEKRSNDYTKFYIDGLFVVSILLAILTQRCQSVLLAAVTGFIYTSCGIAGHNYFHQRDNYRMKYFNLIFSYRDWRISHVFSHHTFPNSSLDCEHVLFGPIFDWRPTGQAKNLFRKCVWYINAVFGHLFLYPSEFARKLINSLTIKNTLHADEFLPFVFPILMYYFGGSHSFMSAWKFFALVIGFGGYAFGIVGSYVGIIINHPELMHDRDAIKGRYDWGIYTLDTIMDREERRSNTTFVDHALHHLFPTIDHVLLPQLRDTLLKTLSEFEADYTVVQ